MWLLVLGIMVVVGVISAAVRGGGSQPTTKPKPPPKYLSDPDEVRRRYQFVGDAAKTQRVRQGRTTIPASGLRPGMPILMNDMRTTRRIAEVTWVSANELRVTYDSGNSQTLDADSELVKSDSPVTPLSESNVKDIGDLRPGDRLRAGAEILTVDRVSWVDDDTVRIAFTDGSVIDTDSRNCAAVIPNE